MKDKTLTLPLEHWRILSREISSILMTHNSGIFKPYNQVEIKSSIVSQQLYLSICRIALVNNKIQLCGRLLAGNKKKFIELVTVHIGDVENSKDSATVTRLLYHLGIDYKDEEIYFPLLLVMSNNEASN
jgi:hypothetical protein